MTGPHPRCRLAFLLFLILGGTLCAPIRPNFAFSTVSLTVPCPASTTSVSGLCLLLPPTRKIALGVRSSRTSSFSVPVALLTTATNDVLPSSLGALGWPHSKHSSGHRCKTQSNLLQLHWCLFTVAVPHKVRLSSNGHQWKKILLPSSRVAFWRPISPTSLLFMSWLNWWPAARGAYTEATRYPP